MLKLLIFFIGLGSGISIHYIIAPSAGPESIDETEVSSIEHVEAKNEKQLLREIAALKQRADTTIECPNTIENNSISNSTIQGNATWEEESELQLIETENLEEQFEQGQVMEY